MVTTIRLNFLVELVSRHIYMYNYPDQGKNENNLIIMCLFIKGPYCFISNLLRPASFDI